MRSLCALILTSAAVTGLAAVAGCIGPGRGEVSDPAQPTVAARGPADNSRCHVCHMNYEDDKLAVTHAKEGIGCEACHGRCDAHCGDEDNVTPPDRMYPRGEVAALCKQCHPLVKLVDVTEHKPVLASIEANKKRCTECHGDHVMAERVVQWDKRTGKLLP